MQGTKRMNSLHQWYTIVHSTLCNCVLVFRVLDLDNDGWLSLSELHIFYVDALNILIATDNTQQAVRYRTKQKKLFFLL